MFSDPNLVNNLILAIIAISNLLTAVVAYKNHTALKGVKADVAIVEKATNSMKDALIKASGEAGETRGEAKGYKAGVEASRNGDSK